MSSFSQTPGFRNSYPSEPYEPSSYKVMPQSYHQTYTPTTMPNTYPPQTSIALFHIPSDATNSLYVDGVPNDASEREVSRKTCLK